MSEERKKILKMLAEGKITPHEAEQLIDALGGDQAEYSNESASPLAGNENPKFLRVVVESTKKGKENINIRIPLQIIRAGVKLSGILPDKAKGKMKAKLEAKGINIDLNDLNPDSLDPIIRALTEMNIEVDEPDEKVRIFCE
jgi:hypothetical protein